MPSVSLRWRRLHCGPAGALYSGEQCGLIVMQSESCGWMTASRAVRRFITETRGRRRGRGRDGPHDSQLQLVQATGLSCSGHQISSQHPRQRWLGGVIDVLMTCDAGWQWWFGSSRRLASAMTVGGTPLTAPVAVRTRCGLPDISLPS